eukprot:2750497-Prymnesium_polylepis.1
MPRSRPSSLKRLWTAKKTSKQQPKTTPKKAGDNTFKSDTVISAVDMATAGLKLIGVDTYEILAKTSSASGSSTSTTCPANKKKKKEESDDESSGGESDDSEMDRCEDIVAQRFRKMP